MISLADVEHARETIRGRVHRTPMLSSSTLGVHIKAELFQKTGSFKVRGVLNRLAELTDEERGRGVISISAGNHAQALAWGAAQAGIDALVVMWQGASTLKVEATRGYGAAVDLEAPDPTTAFARLEELQAETGRTLVHPFNDAAVIAGQGTVGLEILEDVPDADIVLVPVGGGGLVSGIAVAVKALRPAARVIAVEPELSTALHDALAAGHSVPVVPRSAADALSAPFAGERSVEICAALGVESVLVSEDDLFGAFRWLYARMKLACELGAAASTAALLSGKVTFEKGQTVVAVVSGGNVAAQQAAAILAS
ncbi:MAG TPA: threonine/serine dehydratase [Gaiellaceae bacterium]|nr:threonine/serine dehydratase [Gaiellaceae bacterium]